MYLLGAARLCNQIQPINFNGLGAASGVSSPLLSGSFPLEVQEQEDEVAQDVRHSNLVRRPKTFSYVFVFQRAAAMSSFGLSPVLVC